ncbi:hypothetical protein C7B64_04105 [Merismopedia glauca CCAP 1448/3]|uniref:Uncharacterized protein n=1 Tax=Merismopedia glauca CCAP 1448/3 TaxID=1296344 RepID=A0A2T1C7Z5_9CYAN|nr:hypothetical protein C7B64_04105 [Merismopedia glauca CCAP 1448/3]
MSSDTCPCCGNTLLRHAKSNRLYWFCNSCHQEMFAITGDCVWSREGNSRLSTAVKSFKGK